MSLLNRLNRELESFGKKAQAALDEGKVQLELLRVRRQRDGVARDLGLLVHRRERTGEAEPRRIDALMTRIDDLEQEIARLQRQMAAERGETVSVDSAPMPTRGEAAGGVDEAGAPGPVG
jgi:multidrug efflux pump subunit AcrA (membrane-fusion protein)